MKLTGLVAATHTAFHPDGSLNLDAVELQAAHLQKHGIATAFIGGSTGESHSLRYDERIALAERWMQVAAGSGLDVVVHVGCNCLDDAAALAAHSAGLGVKAISALAPSYFKPRSMQMLVDCCQRIAAAAPETPFYFYDIPVLTGVVFGMPDFLEAAAERIPNLAGIKFTNADFMAYQICLNADGGKWDIPWGIDEMMLGALATGAQGAVGSSYNFAAPVYQRLMAAFAKGDMAAAREEQWRSVCLIRLLASYGYMGAAKAVMGMLGVPVGPARLPNATPTAAQVGELRAALETLGFFDWIR